MLLRLELSHQNHTSPKDKFYLALLAVRHFVPCFHLSAVDMSLSMADVLVDLLHQIIISLALYFSNSHEATVL